LAPPGAWHFAPSPWGRRLTVQAEVALVQTSNAARPGLVDREKMEDIALKTWDFAGYFKLLPGV
jgi:hypothetical protein